MAIGNSFRTKVSLIRGQRPNVSNVSGLLSGGLRTAFRSGDTEGWFPAEL